MPKVCLESLIKLTGFELWEEKTYSAEKGRNWLAHSNSEFWLIIFRTKTDLLHLNLVMADDIHCWSSDITEAV